MSDLGDFEGFRLVLSQRKQYLIAAFTRSWSNPRLRAEVGWVGFSKLVEFLSFFALLKVLATQLGRAGYGEYNLTETSAFLLSCIVVAPLYQSFLRDYYGAAERDERRAAWSFACRWLGGVTLASALLFGSVSPKLAEWFDVGVWTPLAGGLLFLCERWRQFGQEVLNIERRRRRAALLNSAFAICQIGAVVVALRVGPATATTALLAFAAVSGLFALFTAGPLVKAGLSAPAGRPSGLPRLVVTYGLPYAALLLLQWIQGFSDRYMVKALLDAESVGLYVAAYQIMGVPYALVLRMGADLLTPIAYQRSGGGEDPERLWSADKVLAAGIGGQVAIGCAMLGFYALFGRELMVLMTSDQFVLPTTTLITLAAARFAQSIAMASQPIFAVHQRMQDVLWFRLAGAVVTLPTCWYMISHYGIDGAALGAFLSLTAFLGLVYLGPNGACWLVREARRGAHSAARARQA